MLGKRCRPVIRKLPDLIITGGMSAQTEAILSPTSPLERDARSPKGWKNRESEGVGLGILAALEKPGGDLSAKLVVGSCNFNLSSPIAINYSPRTMSRVKECLEDIELSPGSSDHASMTGHELHQSPCKGIFCVDGCEEVGDDLMRWRENGFFYASQPRFTEEVVPVFPVADFLSFCYLCRKKLHGRDIYMYRGEKAFCSMECRYRQIVSDEVQEKCGSEASKSSDISSSPYSNGERLFYTGIMAA